ncbi:MAG: hypothetical protein STSR0007_10970 [Thermovirga sp.]
MRDNPIRLVFMGGVPYWCLPEGNFLKADTYDGKIVEPRIRLKSTCAPW